MGNIQTKIEIKKMKNQDVTACPKCKRLVEAKDYTRHPLGSILPTIMCSCGYRGIPIQITMKEYVEWSNGLEIKEEKK